MKKVYVLISIIFVGLISSWLVAGTLVAPVPMAIPIPNTTLPIQDFKLESKSGSSLSGWHIRSEGRKGIVLLFHGIRGNRLSMFSRAKMLYENGYSTILIDFQAHGESSGKQITVGHLEKYDVQAVVGYAKKTHPGAPLGVIGVSMGGASALLASPLEIDALVIESVYPDIRRAVHNRVNLRLGPLSWLPAEILLAQLTPRLGIKVEELSPIDKIGDISCPILVISGRKDLHTTVGETLELYSEAPEPKKIWLVDDAAHEDIFSKSPFTYKKKILTFLNSRLGQE